MMIEIVEFRYSFLRFSSRYATTLGLSFISSQNLKSSSSLRPQGENKNGNLHGETEVVAR